MVNLTKLNYSEGRIASLDPVIEDVYFSGNVQAQIFTLNLSAVTVTNNTAYLLVINGASVTFIYTGNSGLQDFTAQLRQFINSYGVFWAQVTGTNIITITARVSGVQNSLVMGAGLLVAVLTQTQAGISPIPPTPGTLLFWSGNLDSVADTTDRDHRTITTMNSAMLQSGYNLFRSCAGVYVQNPLNQANGSAVNSEIIQVMRRGVICVKNYGVVPINRSSPTILVNTAIGTSLAPAGCFGVGTAIGSDLYQRIQATSFMSPGMLGLMRINLI